MFQKHFSDDDLEVQSVMNNYLKADLILTYPGSPILDDEQANFAKFYAQAAKPVCTVITFFQLLKSIYGDRNSMQTVSRLCTTLFWSRSTYQS